MDFLHRLFLRRRSEQNKNKIRPVELLYYGQNMDESRAFEKQVIKKGCITPLRKLALHFLFFPIQRLEL